MKHLVFIVNPHAGVDRTKEIEQSIERNIDKELYSHEISYTAHAGHGIELAGTAARNGAYAVIAVGGDGSVNDVMRGLLGTSAVMGIIPKGSGNGMARNLGIPLDLDAAMRVINAGSFVGTDIGFAGGRAFISNAGVAFDALIAHEFASSKRRGFAVYSWLVTKNLWAYRPMAFNIEVDGQSIVEEAFMVVVANGRQFGYNFQIAPMADHTDGVLDVIIIRRFPRLMGALISWQALKGRLMESRYVRHIRGSQVTVSHPDLHLMQVDGDPLTCASTVQFTVQPAALKILAPKL